MSKQSLIKDDQNVPRRCVDVTRPRLEPCSLTTSSTQTTCIPETRCPAPVCNEEEDCHDLYCTSETCKQADKCEETLPNICPYGTKDEENPSKDVNEDCCNALKSALNREGAPELNLSKANLSEITKTSRWEPDSSLGKKNTKAGTSKALEKSEAGQTSVCCTKTNRCKSARCSSRRDDCPCHFPPSFSQYSCTGKISGNCNCAQNK